MKKLIPIFCVLLCAVFGCQKETTIDTSFSLYYAGVSEICPGTDFSLTPTYHGTAPTNYQIIGVTFNGEAYQTDCFSVDPGTGRFTISKTDKLPTGKWVIGISCESDGQTYSYPKAIELQLMKSVPDGIFVKPNELKCDLSAIVSGPASDLPTAQITTDGNNHVKITSYLISNIYRDGETVTGECKKWFNVSETGVFSIVENNADFIPGIYTFDFKLTTYASGKETEEGIFAKALRLNVTSKPLSLIYDPKAVTAERNYSYKSEKPVLVGSKAGLKYSIKSVSPDLGIPVSIDEVFGNIIFPENYPVDLGTVFTISVTATNDFGSTDFDDALTITIVSFIQPVTKCVYPDIDSKISGVAFTNEVKEVKGDEVTYSFGELPEGFGKLLSIDKNTGTITCAKGNELPVGDHQVQVIASNRKGDFPTTFRLNILKNPYKFTTVLWGNNMGLTPAEDYGNQFRLEWDQEPVVAPIIYSDIPADVPVKFTYTPGYQYSSNRHGVNIDATTGTVTIYPNKHVVETNSKGAAHYYYSLTDYQANRVNVGWITVTCGGNDEAAITKIFPFFTQKVGYAGLITRAQDGKENTPITQVSEKCPYKILYTPFVFRVNPKKGGRSVKPVVSHKNGDEVKGFRLDYRRGFNYFNFYGPASHGALVSNGCAMSSSNKGVLAYKVWESYATATKTAVNVGAASPVGYFANKNYLQGRLPLTGCYVDNDETSPDTFLTMVVNPEKWVDDNGYANGAFVANMVFNINSNDPSTNQDNDWQYLPIIIWLDDTYDK